MSFDRAFRHRVTLEAMVCWRDADGREHTAVGATRDVNAQGVYLYFTEQCPPSGAAVTISALLPAFLQRNGVTYLRGPGIVTRVEDEGFALHGEFRVETEYVRIFSDESPAVRISLAAA